MLKSCLLTCLGSLVILASTIVFADDAPKNPVEKVPENLEITLEKGEGDLPPYDIDANDKVYEKNKSYFKLNIKNTGKQKVVIWGHFTATMTDAQDKPVDHSAYIGMYGLRTNKKSILEQCKFVELAPGKTHTIKFGLIAYPDPLFMASWELKTPGDYNLHVRYQYDRAEVKEQMGEDCKLLDKPTTAWNRALEVDKTLSVKFTVK